MSTPTPSRDEVSLRESDISRSGLFSRPLFAVVAVLAIFLLLLAAFSNAKVLLDSQRQRLDGISARALMTISLFTRPVSWCWRAAVVTSTT